MVETGVWPLPLWVPVVMTLPRRRHFPDITPSSGCPVLEPSWQIFRGISFSLSGVPWSRVFLPYGWTTRFAGVLMVYLQWSMLPWIIPIIKTGFSEMSPHLTPKWLAWLISLNLAFPIGTYISRRKYILLVYLRKGKLSDSHDPPSRFASWKRIALFPRCTTSIIHIDKQACLDFRKCLLLLSISVKQAGACITFMSSLCWTFFQVTLDKARFSREIFNCSLPNDWSHDKR